MIHEVTVRVTFADTDATGIIYYGRYFTYFEQGFLGFLRSMDIGYQELTAQGIRLPVVEAQCRYLAPSRVENVLLIRTRLIHVGSASLKFGYEIHNQNQENRLVAKGFTRHAVLGKIWKPKPWPASIKSILLSELKPEKFS